MPDIIEIELIEGDVRVSWVNLGEGWSGDYNEDDPDDENLLRFDVERRAGEDEFGVEWEAVDDASYCTAVRADTNPEALMLGLRAIMGYVKDKVEGWVSIKKECEWLSWMNTEELELTLARGIGEEGNAIQCVDSGRV